MLRGQGALTYAGADAIAAARAASSDPFERASLLADLCRLNTLYMIMQAGSGHIGSSLSAMDLITWLWTEELVEPNSGATGADTYFSSKGHDAPGLYSLLIALGKLDFDLLHKLRRLGGLPGHPDVSVPGIAANTGSLGMGISKAKGIVQARRLQGKPVRVFVMTGDGELQEGQLWESLPQAVNLKMGEITAIVDCNKIQSDLWTAKVSDYGDVPAKARAFGWHSERCDGHDLASLSAALERGRGMADKPKFIVADTVKGKGVS